MKRILRLDPYLKPYEEKIDERAVYYKKRKRRYSESVASRSSPTVIFILGFTVRRGAGSTENGRNQPMLSILRVISLNGIVLPVQ